MEQNFPHRLNLILLSLKYQILTLQLFNHIYELFFYAVNVRWHRDPFGQRSKIQVGVSIGFR